MCNIYRLWRSLTLLIFVSGEVILAQSAPPIPASFPQGAPPMPSSSSKMSNTIGPDLNKLFLCKRDFNQDPDLCKRYITFFCSGYCTHDGCSDCSNRGVCLDVCGETGSTMMACVESNKNCASPDQIFSSFLTPDAKNAIQQYASQSGPTQFAVRPPTPAMIPGVGGFPGAVPGIAGGIPGINPGASPGAALGALAGAALGSALIKPKIGGGTGGTGPSQ